MRSQGFTLVEILIVVIILGILAAIVVPQFSEASADAKESALASDLQTVRSQLELYKLQHKGVYATDVTLLTKKTDADGVEGGSYGPYLLKFPTNPFAGNADIEIATKGAGTKGWFYDSATGEFCPNDADHLSW